MVGIDKTWLDKQMNKETNTQQVDMIDNIPILSVIVPVYNVEKYVDKAIRSVLASSLRNIEIIVIDDGSTDKTLSICKRLAVEDARIKLIHQENTGVSTARNNALKIAKGKYFTFMDGDDYIEPEMYEEMIAAIQKTGAELACCGFVRERNGEKADAIHFDDAVLSQEELLYALFGRQNVTTSACNKLALRSIQAEKGIFFNSDWHVCEDGAFWTDYSCEINKAVLLSKEYYHYVMRDDSAVHDYNLTPRRLSEHGAREHIIKKYYSISPELGAFAEASKAEWWTMLLFQNYCDIGMNAELKKYRYTITFQFMKLDGLKKTRTFYFLIAAVITKYGLGQPIAKGWQKLMLGLNKAVKSVISCIA